MESGAVVEDFVLVEDRGAGLGLRDGADARLIEAGELVPIHIPPTQRLCLLQRRTLDLPLLPGLTTDFHGRTVPGDRVAGPFADPLTHAGPRNIDSR